MVSVERRCEARPASDSQVDLEWLIESWRTAFESSEDALRAANHDLRPAEVAALRRRLGDERAATATLLDEFAQERHASSFLVRLATSSWEAKRLLGLPTDAAACVFNADGVLVASAAIHARAWKRVLDGFVRRRIERTGEPLASFSIGVDYPASIHGRTRVEAIHAFLASRGIALPEGLLTDPPTAETVNGLANAKVRALAELVAQQGVAAYEGARLYLELVHDAHMASAVVSGSTNTRLLLSRAHLDVLVDDLVDGTTMRAEHLSRKPAPDALLAACRHLGVEPERTVVFETTGEGVAAGRAASVEFVVGIGREGGARALEARGADVVAASLGDMLDRQLAAG
jgi:HAD superfamily hydrolase (TIGR01509 family)